MGGESQPGLCFLLQFLTLLSLHIPISFFVLPEFIFRKTSQMLLNKELLLQLINVAAHFSQHRAYSVLCVGQIIDKDGFFLLVGVEVGFGDFGAVGPFVLAFAAGRLFLRHFLILLQIISYLGPLLRPTLIITSKLDILLLQLIHGQLILLTTLILLHLLLFPILFFLFFTASSLPPDYLFLGFLSQYFVDCLFFGFAAVFLVLCFQLLDYLRLVKHHTIFSDRHRLGHFGPFSEICFGEEVFFFVDF